MSSLSVNFIKTKMKTKLDAKYGPPVTPLAIAEQAKYTEAIAELLFEILTQDMVVTVAGVQAGPASVVAVVS